MIEILKDIDLDEISYPLIAQGISKEAHRHAMELFGDMDRQAIKDQLHVFLNSAIQFSQIENFGIGDELEEGFVNPLKEANNADFWEVALAYLTGEEGKESGLSDHVLKPSEKKNMALIGGFIVLLIQLLRTEEMRCLEVKPPQEYEEIVDSLDVYLEVLLKFLFFAKTIDPAITLLKRKMDLTKGGRKGGESLRERTAGLKKWVITRYNEKYDGESYAEAARCIWKELYNDRSNVYADDLGQLKDPVNRFARWIGDEIKKRTS